MMQVKVFHELGQSSPDVKETSSYSPLSFYQQSLPKEKFGFVQRSSLCMEELCVDHLSFKLKKKKQLQFMVFYSSCNGTTYASRIFYGEKIQTHHGSISKMQLKSTIHGPLTKGSAVHLLSIIAENMLDSSEILQKNTFLWDSAAEAVI